MTSNPQTPASEATEFKHSYVNSKTATTPHLVASVSGNPFSTTYNSRRTRNTGSTRTTPTSNQPRLLAAPAPDEAPLTSAQAFDHNSHTQTPSPHQWASSPRTHQRKPHLPPPTQHRLVIPTPMPTEPSQTTTHQSHPNHTHLACPNPSQPHSNPTFE